MYKNILAIGESFHGTHLKEIKQIFDNLGDLDKIFIEKPINQQSSVDLYIEKQEIDIILSDFFKRALKEGKNIKETELFIFDFSIKNNIPIFCIDSSKIQTEEYNNVSPHGRWFLRGESRDQDMFNEIVEKYRKGEKAVIFCGAMHLADGKHHRTGKDTLGERLKNKFEDYYEKIILK